MIVLQGSRIRLLEWLLGCLLLLAPQSAVSNGLPPSPSPHYVYDDAAWLSPSAFQSLDARLAAYERETSSQMLVAVFKQLPGDAEMFDFCQRVYESWKPGRENADNGVILFVFSENRQLRIHTGYGMEGALPDARCKQIIDDVIVPRIKQGDRVAAITEGVQAMIAATKGEYQGLNPSGEDANQGFQKYLVVSVWILMIVVVMISVKKGGSETVIRGGGSSRNTGWGGGGFSGGGFSGGGGSSGGGGASGGW